MDDKEKVPGDQEGDGGKPETSDTAEEPTPTASGVTTNENIRDVISFLNHMDDSNKDSDSVNNCDSEGNVQKDDTSKDDKGLLVNLLKILIQFSIVEWLI